MGCIRQELYRLSIPYEVLPCVSWRSILGIKGKGRDVLKKKAQEYILNKYGIEINSDIADAICIGIAYIKRKNIYMRYK